MWEEVLYDFRVEVVSLSALIGTRFQKPIKELSFPALITPLFVA